MNELFQNSLFAGVTLSLVAYFIGAELRKRFHLGLFNPLLISIAVSIAVLAAGGISYDVYNEGAKYLSWLLTPATVCLAIPLQSSGVCPTRNTSPCCLSPSPRPSAWACPRSWEVM